MSGPPDIALFVGRLHPLLVHLPIGLILLLALLEVATRVPRFRHAHAAAGFVLALALPAAIFAAVCGWLLSLGGGYDARLLQWHKWTGIATAVTCLIAAVLYRLDLKRAYQLCLGSSLLVLIVASHFGGSLTHGSDYLVRYAPAPIRKLLGAPPALAKTPPANSPKDIGSTPVFAGLVQPVFQQNCIACHGPEKSKGGLRLDSLQAALKGGKDGPVIVAGKAAESELLKRVRLPATDEDHMPPEGKPQPSADDLALLEWWINSGAPADKKVADLKPPTKIAGILAKRFGAPRTMAKAVAPKPLDQILPLASTVAGQLNIAVAALSQKEPWLQCNASVAGTNFGDAELAQLAPLAANLRWLDLGGTRVTDAGLHQVAAMANLTRLHLERTAITDDGLNHLADLANLEYLNLYGTTVTDAGLEHLQDLRKLKQVYLWETKVTTNAVAAFVDARTDKDQLQRWEQQIEQLKNQVREAHITVDLGTVLAAAPATSAAPINTQCPVSGKPIDPSKTVLHEGKLIAFCCDDCKARFQADAKPFLAKLSLSSTNGEAVVTKSQ